jgi:hypothetical protein
MSALDLTLIASCPTEMSPFKIPFKMQVIVVHPLQLGPLALVEYQATPPPFTAMMMIMACA